MKKIPVVDISQCSLCEGCIEICPSVFSYNSLMDFLEVADLEEYPQDEVDEAIRDCPKDCIKWETE